MFLCLIVQFVIIRLLISFLTRHNSDAAGQPHKEYPHIEGILVVCQYNFFPYTVLIAKIVPRLFYPIFLWNTAISIILSLGTRTLTGCSTNCVE